MWTKESSAERLVLEAWPRAGVGLALVMVVFSVASHGSDDPSQAVFLPIGTVLYLSGLAVFGRRTKVTFNRRSGLVTRKVTSAFGSWSAQVPIDAVRCAEVMTDKDVTGDDPFLHVPALRLKDGNAFLLWRAPVAGIMAGQRATANVAAINRWLASVPPTLDSGPPQAYARP